MSNVISLPDRRERIRGRTYCQAQQELGMLEGGPMGHWERN